MVLSMDRWRGKVAVVTGASAGCGAAIATRLVQEGMKVLALARRVDKLKLLSDKLAGLPGQLYTLQADVTEEDTVLAAFKWATENLGPIHVLVNSAGLSKPTTLSDGSTEMWKTILDTNVLGLSIATREAVRDMKKNNTNGQIIHINSVLGHYVAHIPNLNMYAASKFAVTALTETLRQEFLCDKLKIRICSISPGPVNTEFFTINAIDTQNAGFEEFMDELPMLEADDVADAVLYVLSTPPHVQVQDIMLRPLGEPVESYKIF